MPDEILEVSDAQSTEADYADRLGARLLSLRVDAEAREQFARERAGSEWSPPWAGASASLADQFDLPRESPKWLVDRLLGWGHNAVLAAQHGTGKTTFGLNLARALVDRLPFLDREVAELDGRVGWINGEMDQFDLLDYARPMKFKAAARVAAMHLRDSRLPLINDYAAECFVKWCVDNEVRVLVVDSWRRLCAWCGVDENVNAEVEVLTARVDQIKKQAGISAFVALAHTGRARAEEGEERVRGATALDDWVDARWVMARGSEKDTRDKRYFFAEKRGVEFAETELVFDPARYRLSLGTGNRRDAVVEAIKLKVLMVLSRAGEEGLITSEVAKELGVSNKHTGPVTKALNALEAVGEVRSVRLQPNGRRWFAGGA